MDESSVTQNRRSRRSNVLLAAVLETDGASVPVKLRNLSGEGALVQGPQLPPAGEIVLFRRNELAVLSRVAWVHGVHAGIAFSEPLKPEDVLRNVPQPKLKVPVDFKRPGLACRELTDRERAMMERWA